MNCFTPVACAIDTRLNGGYRLVSTYGANPAAPPDGDPADAAGDELAALLGAVPADLVWEGVAEPLGERGAERLGVGDTGDTDGAELAVGFPTWPPPPAWHEVPLMVQPAGFPGVPEDSVSKPTVTVLPGPTVASQLSFVTVTAPPLSVYEPFQREVSDVPFGSAKASFQPLTALVPGLVIVYWPV